MADELLEQWQEVFNVWQRFIKGTARLKHVSSIVALYRDGPMTLAGLSKVLDRDPESVRNDLHKLGDIDSHGKPGDRLVQKVRFDDRKGLFFKLTARGELAVEEAMAALEEQQEPDFYSFADEDDCGMMGDWMCSRDFVRG
jgi:DNA-binding MarR family transcriptional regulator